MAKMIFKWRINGEEGDFPAGKVVLFGRDMQGELCVWIESEGRMETGGRIASVDANNSQRLTILPTGMTASDNSEHVMSFNDRGMIWHLYRVAK